MRLAVTEPETTEVGVLTTVVCASTGDCLSLNIRVGSRDGGSAGGAGRTGEVNAESGCCTAGSGWIPFRVFAEKRVSNVHGDP